MTSTTNTNTNTAPEDKAHRELGNTIREATKVLGIGSNDPTLLAYESIADAANAVIQEGTCPGNTTVSVAAFDEALELRDEMWELIRAHKVTIRKVFKALDKVTY